MKPRLDVRDFFAYLNNELSIKGKVKNRFHKGKWSIYFNPYDHTLNFMDSSSTWCVKYDFDSDGHIVPCWSLKDHDYYILKRKEGGAL